MILAALVIYIGSVAFGAEQPYLNGTTFNTDPQFNYEPVVSALPVVATHDIWAPGPQIHHKPKPVCCVEVPTKPDVPQSATPEPGSWALFCIALFVWACFGARVSMRRIF